MKKNPCSYWMGICLWSWGAQPWQDALPLCEPVVLPPWKQINPVTPALNYFKVLTFALSLVGHSAVGAEETSKYQWGSPGCFRSTGIAKLGNLAWSLRAEKQRRRGKPLSDILSTVITLDIVLQRSSWLGINQLLCLMDKNTDLLHFFSFSGKILH